MKILGIRTSSTCVRYAIIEWNGNDALLINSATENKLNFPADKQTISQKLLWLNSELDRIYRINQDISKVAIKMNQFGTEKMANRYSSNMDGVVILSAMKNMKQVKTFLYANIQTKMSSKKIKEFSEINVGKTEKYWDSPMADAVAVAWTWRNE